MNDMHAGMVINCVDLLWSDFRIESHRDFVCYCDVYVVTAGSVNLCRLGHCWFGEPKWTGMICKVWIYTDFDQ